LATQQTLKIPPIKLVWTDWYSWNRIAIPGNRKEAIKIPAKPGVYEVTRHRNSSRRLAIGEGADLQRRVRRNLVQGKGKHSASKRISSSVDTDRLSVRWAVTEWPKAAEEYLHKQYVKNHGQLPKYTLRT